MFHNKEEENFLFSQLKKEMDILEWGSGLSTLAISPLVNSIVSIEYNQKWFDEMEKRIFSLKTKNNILLHHIPANNPNYEGDGTYEEFKDYILYPEYIKRKFDVIFIDGRARIECAKMACSLLKKHGIIVIHDIFHPVHKWRRYEYDAVLEFLEHTGGVFTMHSFIPKNIHE